MTCRQRILFFECLGFLGIIVFLWAEEWIDLPHLLFMMPPTPFNYVECLMETVLIVAWGAMILAFTRCILQKMEILEGMLPICGVCKKVRINPDADDLDQKNWVLPEEYFAKKTELNITHGICPDCARRLYPEAMRNIEKKGEGH